MNKEAIAQEVWHRNSIRREAQLPLLPVKETYDREVKQAKWRAIVEAHYDRVAAEILAEQRAGNPDWGNSWGGRLALRLMTEKTLRERYLRR